MPDEKRDVTHFTRYFGINTPKAQYLAAVLIVIGAATGIIIELLIHSTVGLPYLILYGASSGVAVVALPAILTALLLKAMNRRLKLRHGFFAVLAITVIYCLFLIATSAIYKFTGNHAIEYVLFLLSNAIIYGYWFMINRVVLNQRKSQILTAAIQPMLNILLYVPASPYLLSLGIPINVLLIKLWAGMVVFMLCGYAILYIMDRPSKRELNFSGVELMSSMIHQWLYNVNKDYDVLDSSGVARDLPVEVLSIKGAKGAEAVFVKPEIHYGPIAGVGGSNATEHLSAQISKLGVAPFVLHGLVNMEDNPVSSKQTLYISRAVVEKVKGTIYKKSFSVGGIGVGKSGPCTATAVQINDSCILTLTKAPTVTEDIDREVGLSFTNLAKTYFGNVIIIDAHNSRFEYASTDELRGVYKGSKYIAMYEKAITSALESLKSSTPVKLRFGCASVVPKNLLKNKDIGKGHLSACVFNFGIRSFCMVYFDANNMLPGFRSKVLEHIKARFNLDAELYTTDTHAVNTLSLPASNVLGRETKPSDAMPIIDDLINRSLRNIGPASSSYSEVLLKGFKVWGKGSEDTMMKVSRDIIHIGKRRLPVLITGFFILAMWAIYLA